MRRRKLSRGSSRRMFSSGAQRVHVKNLRPMFGGGMVMRGGIRL